MAPKRALQFSARVHKLGINTCVDVPPGIVNELRGASLREVGPISAKARLNGTPFKTTVIRYAGAWRLYLNTAVRAEAAVGAGDQVMVELQFDPIPRTVSMPPQFAAALAADSRARAAFEDLTPSHRKDILNYLNSLKTAEALERNVRKAIAESLAGRHDHRSRTRRRSAGDVSRPSRL